jgi:hypothetical protein
LIAIVVDDVAAGQDPLGLLAVKVTVALPAAISAAVGVYVAFKVVALGANVPAPLHATVVAPPPIEAVANAMVGLLAQTGV